MSKYWVLSFITSFCLIGISLIVVAFTVKNHLERETPQVRFESLYESKDYSFTTFHNNLNIIVLHLKNPGLENKDTYKFSIVGPAGILVSQTFTGFNVGDPSDLRFQFEPIRNADKNKLTIRLEAPLGVSKPLSLGVDENGEIAFASYYRTESKMNTLIDIIKNLIINIGRDPLFFGSFLIILLLIFWKWKDIG